MKKLADKILIWWWNHSDLTKWTDSKLAIFQHLHAYFNGKCVPMRHFDPVAKEAKELFDNAFPTPKV
jgi:hypothetical protein